MFDKLKAEEERLSNYMNTIRKIDNIFQTGIEPVDITKNYSAGWLAPNGKFYGVNGERANQLHINLADALLDAGIVPQTTREDGLDCKPEVWMEQNGWIKIHGDEVLYEGYFLKSRFNKENIPVTDKQIQQLLQYAKTCHNSRLFFGIAKKPVTTNELRNMDKPMLQVLFTS